MLVAQWTFTETHLNFFNNSCTANSWTQIALQILGTTAFGGALEPLLRMFEA